MPGKTAGLKVEVTEVQRRVSTGSVRRISDTSRSSVMSPTVLSAKVNTKIGGRSLELETNLREN